MLTDVTIDLNTDSTAVLGLEIKKLKNILQHATKTSIEGHKSHAGTKKPRGRGKWNSEISEASQKSRAIHKEIRESSHPSNELKEEQKRAKKD